MKSILKQSFLLYILFGSATILGGCKLKKTIAEPIFKVLESNTTGINFSNTLNYNQQFNLFKYIYFYNGSGVGAGDFNND